MHARLALEVEAREPDHLLALLLELAHAPLEALSHEALQIDDTVPALALEAQEGGEQLGMLGEKLGMRAQIGEYLGIVQAALELGGRLFVRLL